MIPSSRWLRLLGHLSLSLIGLAALGFAAFLLWPAEAGDAGCRAVALIDAATGTDIQGTEDMAYDAQSGMLFISAYDRRRQTPGGVYWTDFEALAAARGSSLRVRPLPFGNGTLRPHGIAIAASPGGARLLYVINRPQGPGAPAAELIVLRLDGESAHLAWRAPLPCGANDLWPERDGSVLFTADRVTCRGLGRFVNDARARREGRIYRLQRTGAPVLLAQGLAFANGIAADAAHVYVAATRSRALLVYDRAALARGLTLRPRVIALPGAPDNLSWNSDGSLAIALHGSVLRFAAFRLGWRRDSPGTIRVYDPRKDRLVPSPRFRLTRILDGPTSALGVDGTFVAGGAFGRGLAICHATGET